MLRCNYFTTILRKWHHFSSCSRRSQREREREWERLRPFFHLKKQLQDYTTGAACKNCTKQPFIHCDKFTIAGLDSGQVICGMLEVFQQKGAAATKINLPGDNRRTVNFLHYIYGASVVSSEKRNKKTNSMCSQTVRSHISYNHGQWYLISFCWNRHISAPLPLSSPPPK